MGTENQNPLPPRIQAAFVYLEHTRRVTEQWDAAIPMRDLSLLERSVERVALQTLQQFLLGEIEVKESAVSQTADAEAVNTS